MAVKIKRTKEVMGELNTVNIYLPDDRPITKDRKEKADALDLEIKHAVEVINEDYLKLDKEISSNDLKKWKWLGGLLDIAIQRLKNVETTDIDNYHIWPGFAQYMRDELMRGYDAKRSGTKKDHYRKAWVLATVDNVEWIKSWGGWDAFVDRGEQLSQNKRLMPLLNNKFKNKKLGTKDYQYIAKYLTEHLPSVRSYAVDIDEINTETLEILVDEVDRNMNERLNTN